MTEYPKGRIPEAQRTISRILNGRKYKGRIEKVKIPEGRITKIPNTK